jgi:carboxylesterase type B
VGVACGAALNLVDYAHRMAWPDQDPPSTDVLLHLNVSCSGGGTPAYLEIDKVADGQYRATVGTLFEHQEICPTARERILANYPAKSYSTPRLAFMQLTIDSEFTCQSRRVARAFSKMQKELVYRYIFTQAQENDPSLKVGGASHTIEHAFLFPGRYQPTEAEAAIQRQMVGYWTRMARTGNLNGGNDPQWPAATVENDSYLEIGATTVVKKGPANAKCDFWDTVTFLWPHL